MQTCTCIFLLTKHETKKGTLCATRVQREKKERKKGILRTCLYAAAPLHATRRSMELLEETAWMEPPLPLPQSPQKGSIPKDSVSKILVELPTSPPIHVSPPKPKGWLEGLKGPGEWIADFMRGPAHDYLEDPRMNLVTYATLKAFLEERLGRDVLDLATTRFALIEKAQQHHVSLAPLLEEMERTAADKKKAERRAAKAKRDEEAARAAAEAKAREEEETTRKAEEAVAIRKAAKQKAAAEVAAAHAAKQAAEEAKARDRASLTILEAEWAAEHAKYLLHESIKAKVTAHFEVGTPVANVGRMSRASINRGSVLRSPLEVQHDREAALQRLRSVFFVFGHAPEVGTEEHPGTLTVAEVARLLNYVLPDAAEPMAEADALDFITDHEGENSGELGFDGFIKGLMHLTRGADRDESPESTVESSVENASLESLMATADAAEEAAFRATGVGAGAKDNTSVLTTEGGAPGPATAGGLATNVAAPAAPDAAAPAGAASATDATAPAPRAISETSS